MDQRRQLLQSSLSAAIEQQEAADRSAEQKSRRIGKKSGAKQDKEAGVGVSKRHDGENVSKNAVTPDNGRRGVPIRSKGHKGKNKHGATEQLVGSAPADDVVSMTTQQFGSSGSLAGSAPTNSTMHQIHSRGKKNRNKASSNSTSQALDGQAGQHSRFSGSGSSARPRRSGDGQYDLNSSQQASLKTYSDGATNAQGSQQQNVVQLALGALSGRTASSPLPVELRTPSGQHFSRTPQSASQTHQSASMFRDVAGSSPANGSSQKKSRTKKMAFKEHCSTEELMSGLKSGRLFRAAFRLNASDRSEAYAAVPGIAVDILIKGTANHNRAIMGDEVAIQVLPASQWYVQHSVLTTNNNNAQSATEPANGQSPTTSSMLTPVNVDSATVTAASATVTAAQAATAAIASTTSAAADSIGASDRVGSAQPLPAGDLSQLLTKSTSFPASTDAWFIASSPEEAKNAVNNTLQTRRELRPTACVVGILQPSLRREHYIGSLVEAAPGGMVWMVPADPRLPRAVVQPSKLPADLKQQLRSELQSASDVPRSIVSARIVEWTADRQFPLVEVRHSLGQAGEIATETAALLESEGVRSDDFGDDVLACLPPTPWRMSESDEAGRRDLREWRIFSIDPPTAKDLDDALSVTQLPNGLLRIGVHIADVSHFVKPNTALDTEARLRSTSVYLVQKVIPMLPPLLCEQLCSLNPGVDRLAFSIVWDMSEDGRIHAQWVGRSIIRTCAKLAYEHAQAVIDGSVQQPAVQLYNKQHWDDVCGDIVLLNKVASGLRKQRFQHGALRLDNVKLSFRLDEDGNPYEATPYLQKASNHLVEEFMLLANQTAARVSVDAFPELAVLRRHPPPLQKKLEELELQLAKVGLQLDSSSSGALHDSLQRIRAAASEQPLTADIVQLLCTKPMKLAEYFCSGSYEDRLSWRHYALSIDLYTHFTSPIRRYPDVLVHRVLAAAIEKLGSITVFDPPFVVYEEPASEPSDQPAALHQPAVQEQQRPSHDPCLQDGFEDVVNDSESDAVASHPLAEDVYLTSMDWEDVVDTVVWSPAVDDAEAQMSSLSLAGAAPSATRSRLSSMTTAASSVPHTAPHASSSSQQPPNPVVTSDALSADTSPFVVDSHAAMHADAQHSTAGDDAVLTEKHGLMGGHDMQQAMTWANERKLAARKVQDGSSKLYLCVMLRKHPVATSAVVVSVNGAKFVDLYIPYAGTDYRLYFDRHPGGLKVEWDDQKRCVIVSAPEGGSQGAQGDMQGGQGALQGVENLSVHPGTNVMKLPLCLKNFDQLSVVLTAVSNTAGSPIDMCARLYVDV